MGEPEIDLLKPKANENLRQINVLLKDGSIKETIEVNTDYELNENEEWATPEEYEKDQIKKLGEEVEEGFKSGEEQARKKEEKTDIKLPTIDRLISEFTYDVCEVLVEKEAEIYFKPNEQEITEITYIEDKKNKNSPGYLGFKTVSSHRFINIVEGKINTGINIQNKKTDEWEFKKKSMNSETAKISLCNDVWRNDLRKIQRIFTVPIPILYEGKLVFPKPGHDERFDSWLIENAPKIDENLPIETAKETLDKIYGEFLFFLSSI